MIALAPADRARLAKLLGLLGSDHAGERDAAGLAAQKFVTGRGMTWQQVLEPVTQIPAVLPTALPWQVMVVRCLERPGSLRPWERGFLDGLRRFPRLSPKQRACLREIADRVLENPS